MSLSTDTTTAPNFYRIRELTCLSAVVRSLIPGACPDVHVASYLRGVGRSAGTLARSWPTRGLAPKSLPPSSMVGRAKRMHFTSLSSGRAPSLYLSAKNWGLWSAVLMRSVISVISPIDVRSVRIKTSDVRGGLLAEFLLMRTASFADVSLTAPIDRPAPRPCTCSSSICPDYSSSTRSWTGCQKIPNSPLYFFRVAVFFGIPATSLTSPMTGPFPAYFFQFFIRCRCV